DDQALPLAKRIAGETVLTGVRVIAIDQQLSQGTTPNGAEPQPARTVTLEVTSSQAERVAVASRLGHLTLVVRPADAPLPVSPLPVSPSPGAPSPGVPLPGTVNAATSTMPVTALAESVPPVAHGAAAPTPAPARDASSGITWGGDVSAALNNERKNGASTTSTLRVFEGSSDGKEFHF
ncbi:MAG: RcpC/CpaB family pilus assembly protein, partial [Janthinobacterium lividum]